MTVRNLYYINSSGSEHRSERFHRLAEKNSMERSGRNIEPVRKMERGFWRYITMKKYDYFPNCALAKLASEAPIRDQRRLVNPQGSGRTLTYLFFFLID